MESSSKIISPDLPDRKERFEKIQAEVAKLKNAGDFRKEMKVKADSFSDDSNECMSLIYSLLSYIESLEYTVGYAMEEISWFNRWINNHVEGHLPNVNGAEQMQRAVTNLGLSDEYEVKKKEIYAEKTRTGNVFRVG